jgi:PAS domain S-box-containing protein
LSRTNALSRKEDRGSVLIVDHDAASVKALSAILRSRGFDVRSASTGPQALRCVKLDIPAVILLAARLPGTDGLELGRRLLQSRRGGQIPLLLIAGKMDLATQRAGFRIGALDVICKPFQEEEVAARVKAYVELSQLRRTAREASGRTAESLRERDEWVHFAMQAGQMSAFHWNAASDGVHRSGGAAQTQELPGAKRDSGRNWFRRIHPDDLPRFLKVISLLSPVYDTYDTHYRMFRPDGTMAHLRESARAFFDAGGRLSRVVGVVSDITEEERRADALRRSEMETLELLRKVPIAMAFADERGGIQYVNERFVQAFGYSLEEVAAPDVWWKRAFPEEQHREEVIRSWRDGERLSRRGSGDAGEQYRLTCKDGSIRMVEIFGATVGDRKLIFFDDVTERRRAEAALFESEDRFRSMADTAPVMIWVSGTDKLCTFFNREWLRYTGRTIQEELGNGWSTRVHPDDLERCLTTYSRAFDAREPFKMEYRLRRADGEYGWIVDQGVARFTPDGVFAGFVGSAIDITEIRRNQEQMVANQKLETLGVLSSGIAHDLNNVLGCILAYTDIISADLGAGSAARDTLRKVETLAIRASELVAQIMAYAGREEIQKEPVNISNLINEMLALLRISIPKGGRLRVDLAPDLPPLQGNAPQLRQVMMNLILNAAESLEERKGLITIHGRLRRIDAADDLSLPPGDYICLQVSDTGIGMTEEVRSRIFDPFFTTKFAGRGLGLAAVLGIVLDHGGVINVDSTPGKGTTFEILLPGETMDAQDKPPTPQNLHPGERTAA